MYTRKISGSITEPWGKPEVTVMEDEDEPSVITF